MKEFFKVLKRYIPPYKKSLILSLIFTFASAILNVFSFMIIIPILQILFKITDTTDAEFIPWSEANMDNIKDIALNNGNYYLNAFIESNESNMPIADIYKKIAEELDLPMEKLAAIVEENCRRCGIVR